MPTKLKISVICAYLGTGKIILVLKEDRKRLASALISLRNQNKETLLTSKVRKSQAPSYFTEFMVFYKPAKVLCSQDAGLLVDSALV